jgi:hypothetical protein
VLVEPAVPVSGGGFLASWARGVFGFWGEFVAEQDGEGLGGVTERHFGDTAADSAHRNGGPRRESAVDAWLLPLACLQIAPTWDALDGRPVRQFAVTAPASGLM